MSTMLKKQRIILSTLIFETHENRSSYVKLLNKDDFETETHQVIFSSILDLHNKNAQIDEINLRVVLEEEKYFHELGQIITAEGVDLNILDDLVMSLKDNSLINEINALPHSFSKIINENKKDKKLILEKTKQLIEQIEEKNTISAIDKDWKSGLKGLKSLLTFEMLNNVESAKSLIKGFFFERTLTVIHSKPGAGKTTLLLGAIKQMLRDDKIDEFIYFDADNPLSVLKDRLPKLQEAFGDKMTYHTHTSSSYDALLQEMKRLCLYKDQGKRLFIVVDTLGKFVDSVNDDKQCKPLMDLLGRLRDVFGATVVLVHHSNKNENDLGRPVFRGSTIISGDCDFMWGIKRKGSETTIYNDKGRLDYFEKINAHVELDTYDLDIEGSYDSKENDDEETTKEISLSTLKSFLQGKEWVSMTDIRKHFKCTNKNRKGEKLRQNELWDLIQDNKDLINWNGETGRNARYKLEDNKPVTIEFKDNDGNSYDMPNIL